MLLFALSALIVAADDCIPGWETYECRDDGTLTRGHGCTSCEDCEAFDLTAETGGRETCEPGTSPIVFYWDENLDGTTDDTWEREECTHNDCGGPRPRVRALPCLCSQRTSCPPYFVEGWLVL